MRIVFCFDGGCVDPLRRGGIFTGWTTRSIGVHDMGREASTYAQVGNEEGEARALLESTELILRGPIKRRFPKTAVEQVRVDGDALRFRVADEAVTLHLGAKQAQSWAAAIAKPPPSLRSKLGLNDDARALLIGDLKDEALAQATDGRLTTNGAQAQMIIAVVEGPADLAKARQAQDLFPQTPLWVIYPKGRGVAFGDGAIRAILREAGLRDTKSCAVSDTLTATRYGR
jgi:hypothetical protein